MKLKELLKGFIQKYVKSPASNMHPFKIVQVVNEEHEVLVFFDYKYVEQGRLGIFSRAIEVALRELKEKGAPVDHSGLKYYVVEGERENGWADKTRTTSYRLVETSKIELSASQLRARFDNGGSYE